MTSRNKVDKLKVNNERMFKTFSNTIIKANSMLKKVKDTINDFKASRKKLGDGIETHMYDWLKTLFHVHLPSYHGGKLIDKDCVWMMANTDIMFTHFAGILKARKKDNCTYLDPMIDELCADFWRLSVLWDDAFLRARKVNLTCHDITQYKRYIKGAIFLHQAMKISITRKRHWWGGTQQSK